VVLNREAELNQSCCYLNAYTHGGRYRCTQKDRPLPSIGKVKLNLI
jgi:hypothetical protein